MAPGLYVTDLEQCPMIEHFNVLHSETNEHFH